MQFPRSDDTLEKLESEEEVIVHFFAIRLRGDEREVLV
jgi:hypothetical protein